MQMIYDPQPIKCVEAVFLALYLTVSYLLINLLIPFSNNARKCGRHAAFIIFINWIFFDNLFFVFNWLQGRNCKCRENTIKF